MNALPSCICGSTAADLVQSGVRHDPGPKVWRCTACGIVYRWPRPNEEELAQYYAEAYRGEYGALSISALKQLGSADTLARVARLRTYLSPATSVLDVGAGVGTFLGAIRDVVHDVTGVEPDAGSRKHLTDELGIAAVASVGDLLDDARFDLITMFHVLEHVPDPRAFLIDASARLRPGASLVIEVPNVDDALVSVYHCPMYSSFYFQKAHLHYFSKGTLVRLCAEAGLESQVELVQRYGLRNHLHWLAAGEPDGDRLYHDAVLDTADVAYRDSLIRTGHADTLWLVARPVAPHGVPADD